jgi:hypothetical protein
MSENNIKDSEPEKKEELSDFSRQLINDTEDLLAQLFPAEEGVDAAKLDDIAINKELILTCIVAILKDMNSEERKILKENPGDIKSILRLAAGKVHFSEEDKNLLKESIDSITPEDLKAQSPIIDKLDLLNLDSAACKMNEALYGSLKKNPEVVQAHAYMNLFGT